jgi:hypothetical protein
VDTATKSVATAVIQTFSSAAEGTKIIKAASVVGATVFSVFFLSFFLVLFRNW